jgi:NAD(P)-dependent dehydrogenase (short-subunit alcohol dehydrogenase family)
MTIVIDSISQELRKMEKPVVLITGALTGIGRATAVAFAKKGAKVVVAVSSTYGHEGAAGASVYVGSKHAVEGITKSVALEIADSGIRVNGVAPGPTDTGMLTRFTRTPENKAALVTGVPMARLGLSEELPTRSSSWHRTKHHSSPATSSTSTAVTPPTDPA